MEKKEKNNKLLNITINVVSAVIILIALVALLFRSSVFGITFYGVLSNSMNGNYEQEGDYPPSFEKDDLIIVKKLSEEEKYNLKPGQVICYYTMIEGNRVINTHRIMQVQKNDDNTIVNYYTAGDYNLQVEFGERENVSDYFDESRGRFDNYQVVVSDIIGIYDGKVENIGKVVNFFQSKDGFLLLVVVPSLLIMFYCAFLFFKALDNFKKEKYALVEQEKQALNEAKRKEELKELLEAEREKIKQELLKEMNDKK